MKFSTRANPAPTANAQIPASTMCDATRAVEIRNIQYPLFANSSTTGATNHKHDDEVERERDCDAQNVERQLQHHAS